jgi:hypothetical protein
LSIERLLRGIDGQKYDIKIKTPEGKIFPLTLMHGKVKERETYPQLKGPDYLILNGMMIRLHMPL